MELSIFLILILILLGMILIYMLSGFICGVLCGCLMNVRIHSLDDSRMCNDGIIEVSNAIVEIKNAEIVEVSNDITDENLPEANMVNMV
jgi:uncharacterized membrane protein YraQ (UPF0718 family)